MMRAWAIVAALLVTGCGSRTAPVSGRVTLDGKALPRAVVHFFPDTDAPAPGPGSHATTDADGRFELALMTEPVKGAIVGKHKVSITAYEGDDQPVSSGSDMVFRKALLPAEYNGDTKLRFEVPAGGTTSADFELFSKGSQK